MTGSQAPWRGQFALRDDLRLTNNSGHITIVGTLSEFDAANNLNIIQTAGVMSLIGKNSAARGKIIIIGDRFTGTANISPGEGDKLIKLNNYKQSAPTTGKQSNVYIIVELDDYTIKYNTK